jgi:hypothetical protein
MSVCLSQNTRGGHHQGEGHDALSSLLGHVLLRRLSRLMATPTAAESGVRWPGQPGTMPLPLIAL